MFLGSDTIRPLLQRLVPEARIESRPRLSRLTYSGPCKITRLPRRSAVVAFSAADVYAIAEVVRRQRGGAAVVMGALSRSEEHTSELQSLMRISYAVFCLEKKKK